MSQTLCFIHLWAERPLWVRWVLSLNSLVGVALLYLVHLNTCTQGNVQGTSYTRCYTDILSVSVLWRIGLWYCTMSLSRGSMLRYLWAGQECRCRRKLWENYVVCLTRRLTLTPNRSPPSLWYAYTALFIVLFILVFFCFDIMCNIKVVFSPFECTLNLRLCLSLYLSVCLSVCDSVLLTNSFLAHVTATLPCLLFCLDDYDVIFRWSWQVLPSHSSFSYWSVKVVDKFVRCTLVLYYGLVLQFCTAALYHGLVPWPCTMALYCDLVLQFCTAALYHSLVPWPLPWPCTITLYHGLVLWPRTAVLYCSLVP